MSRLLILLGLLGLLAGQIQAKEPVRVTALGGLDPVELSASRERSGDEKLTVDRGPYRYRFATAENRQKFEAAPEEYSIQFDGACGRMGPLSGIGAPDRFFVHDRRVYVFASEVCRDTFKSAPENFLDRPDAPPPGEEAERARGMELVGKALTGFGGADKVDAVSNYRVQTKITYGEGEQATSGIHIVTIDFTGKSTGNFTGNLRSEQIWGKQNFAHFIGRDGDFYTQESEWWPITKSSTDFLRRSQLRMPLIALRWRRQPGFVAVSAGMGKVGDATVEYVRIGLQGATTTFAVDHETGRILQSTHRGRGGNVGEVVRTFSDFRPVGGLLLPHQVNESFEGKPITSPVKKIESLTLNSPFDDKLFRKPE